MGSTSSTPCKCPMASGSPEQHAKEKKKSWKKHKLILLSVNIGLVALIIIILMFFMRGTMKRQIRRRR